MPSAGAELLGEFCLSGLQNGKHIIASRGLTSVLTLPPPGPGPPAPHIASRHLLLTKDAVGLQFSFLPGPVYAAGLDPLHPLLGAHGEQQDQVGSEQVRRPLVDGVMGRGQVLHPPAHLGGDGVGGGAVPVPEGDRSSETPAQKSRQPPEVSC